MKKFLIKYAAVLTALVGVAGLSRWCNVILHQEEESPSLSKYNKYND